MHLPAVVPATLDGRGGAPPPSASTRLSSLGCVEGGDKEGTAVFWHPVYAVQLLPLSVLGGEERRGCVQEFPMGWGEGRPQRWAVLSSCVT